MNYYFDMDGVTVRYERSAYKPGPDGSPPLFMQKGQHYFRHLEPDPRMLQVIKILLTMKEHNVYLLTSVCNIGSLCIEQINDKIEWVHEHIPELDTDTQFLAAVSTDKPDIAEFIKFNDQRVVMNGKILSVDDLLIDDYNKNLNDWILAGGKAIKYINGENDPTSFPGLILDQDMTVEDIILLLTKHLDYLRKSKDKHKKFGFFRGRKRYAL